MIVTRDFASTADAAEPLMISGSGLTIEDLVGVSLNGVRVALPTDAAALRRIQASCDWVEAAVAERRAVYGVTTPFGAMADMIIDSAQAAELQESALWLHKCGAGRPLPARYVRAAMALRINSLVRGASGVGLALIERLATFLNAGITPVVHEYGSIGASGDLVPLTYIAGAITGSDAGFRVEWNGTLMDSRAALDRLGLAAWRVRPKEILGLINGTAMSTGIAAHCLERARVHVSLALAVHALYLQALRASQQPFDAFIHQQKPHAGQGWVAALMRDLLSGSRMLDTGDRLGASGPRTALIQDRYSVRCLPQYLGPVVDGLAQIRSQVETEMNSTTDNPLIDTDHDTCVYGGNFLAQYIGIGMDQLRHLVGLTAKHIDCQIALLVAPQFNRGLPASLVGNAANPVNMGLKGLQLTANSIMPLLTYLGAPLSDRYPTHAEQFNQNVNSQSFGSANLAHQSIELMQQYIAIALMFGVQSADLRMYALAGHYDARELLSEPSARLYDAVKSVVGCPPSAARPYIRDDRDQALDTHIAAIAGDVQSGGVIVSAIQPILRSLP
jgi:phenylalanine ammonia-lyase